MTRPTTLEEVFTLNRKDVDRVRFTGDKRKIHCGNLGDLEKIGKSFDISNRGKIVRKIKIGDDAVYIDAMDGNGWQKFPKDREVYYESWLSDRGSYLIYVEIINDYGKLATEFDNLINIQY